MKKTTTFILSFLMILLMVVPAFAVTGPDGQLASAKYSVGSGDSAIKKEGWVFAEAGIKGKDISYGVNSVANKVTLVAPKLSATSTTGAAYFTATKAKVIYTWYYRTTTMKKFQKWDGKISESGRIIEFSHSKKYEQAEFYVVARQTITSYGKVGTYKNNGKAIKYKVSGSAERLAKNTKLFNKAKTQKIVTKSKSAILTLPEGYVKKSKQVATTD